MTLLDHCVFTAQQMQQADQQTIAGGTASYVLMQRAGAQVVHAVCNRWAPRPALVLCGGGNNGGDGYVIAQLLHEAGWPVEVASLILPSTDDAKRAAQDCKAPLTKNLASSLAQSQLIVDAVFGTGLARAVAGELADTIAQVNAHSAPVVAVDIASGISADTGQVLGTAIRADTTVTFCRKKRGHLLADGKEHAGAVVVADIGISEAAIVALAPTCYENHPSLWCEVFPVLSTSGHKYMRGHVAVIGGQMTGAAKLAGLAALRGGAGLVSVLCEPLLWPVYASSLTGVMATSCSEMQIHKQLSDSRINAWLIGPGAGITPRTRLLTEDILNAQRPAVLDADALSVFAGEAAALAALVRAPTILTPHEGEFARLFADYEWAESPDKCERATQAAKLTGAVVLLKGADTVIASPDGRLVLHADAPPWLATAGSGDVLAGLCAGLLAQNMPAFEATSAAAWLHAQAAWRVGQGMIAEDLPEKIPAVLQAL